MADRSQSESALVQFSERLTNSAAFGVLFREGMDLVEETAAYLDGGGRQDSKLLSRSARLAFPESAFFIAPTVAPPVCTSDDAPICASVVCVMISTSAPAATPTDLPTASDATAGPCISACELYT